MKKPFKTRGSLGQGQMILGIAVFLIIATWLVLLLYPVFKKIENWVYGHAATEKKQ